MGIEVRPRSIKHDAIDDLSCDIDAPPQPFRLAQFGGKKIKAKNALEKAAVQSAEAKAAPDQLDIIYSYGVFFEESGRLPWLLRGCVVALRGVGLAAWHDGVL